MGCAPPRDFFALLRNSGHSARQKHSQDGHPKSSLYSGTPGICTRQTPEGGSNAGALTICSYVVLWSPKVPPVRQGNYAQPVVFVLAQPKPSPLDLLFYLDLGWVPSGEFFFFFFFVCPIVVGLESAIFRLTVQCFNHLATHTRAHTHTCKYTHILTCSFNRSKAQWRRKDCK